MMNTNGTAASGTSQTTTPAGTAQFGANAMPTFPMMTPQMPMMPGAATGDASA